MSNSLAIAAVTATLRSLLLRGIQADPDLADIQVTTQPPDKARGTLTVNQLNVFLYQAGLNASWRNRDLPTQAKPGETATPPLPLNLYYLLIAYGRNDDDIFCHRVLGRAMSILHDHPLLGRDEIHSATEILLPGSDLHTQLERVRFTIQPLMLEEISKLWTGFQTQYRLSAAYEATVVLIDSTRAAVTPLPVLTRGPDDSGARAQGNLVPPFPALDEVVLPDQQFSARLGDTLTLTGHHLDGDTVDVRFTTPLLLPEAIIIFAQAGGSEEQITVQLPPGPVEWVAGFYNLAATIHRTGEPDRTTNALPFSLAPRITSPLPITATRDPSRDVTVTLTCSPEVRPAQRVALLVGSSETPAEAHPTQTDTLTFILRAPAAGDFFLRLRVDGVDSLLVDRTGPRPVFDASQKITIPA